MLFNGKQILGIIIAAIAFFMVGFVFYGVLFADLWMAAEGIDPNADPGSPLWMLGGFLISIASAKGMAFVLRWRGWPGIGGALFTAFVLWSCFAVAVLGYDLVYQPNHSWTSFFIDSAHLFVGWHVMAIILSFFGD